MTPILDFSDKARQVIYGIFGGLGLLAALYAVALLVIDEPQPRWYNVAMVAYGVAGAVVGQSAASKVYYHALAPSNGHDPIPPPVIPEEPEGGFSQDGFDGSH